MPVTDKNFYSLSPAGYHATGDIWMRLPAFGLLKKPHCSGLVVTPACDLANCKTETVTYVPIISVAEFWTMPEFLLEIANYTNDWLTRFDVPFTIGPAPEFDCDYSGALQQLRTITPNKNQRALLGRCEQSLNYLAATRNSSSTPEQAVVRQILGPNWDNFRTKIIRNAYRSDLYFLPADAQDATWSAIPRHSVALLRYLMTVPTYFLDEAHRADNSDWSDRRAAFIKRPLHWCEQCDPVSPPLRALRLKDAFLSDLLTRFVALYVRLGAPDMDSIIMDRIENEL